MMYNDLVVAYFFHPEHVGVLDEHVLHGVKAHANNMELYIQMDEENKIIKACFKAKSNPYKIAGLEWLCRQMEGESLKMHPRIDYQQIMEVLELPPLKYPEAIELERLYKNLIKEARQNNA